nr:immunoglobulin heavy chain junction region [Mus musculus]MBK4184990.1 immunoglobulin heavy chain junction region [Mus musculus]MBK4184991.1 immunoglobulin heavy chain junction region [Mus musculus]
CARGAGSSYGFAYW